jgi:hypothetical protein
LPKPSSSFPRRVVTSRAAAVVDDVGYADAGRIFSRLGDLLSQGRQPPISGALSLTDFDA